VRTAEGLSNVADRDRSHSFLPDCSGFSRLFLYGFGIICADGRSGTPAHGKSSGFRPSKSKPDLRLTTAH